MKNQNFCSARGAQAFTDTVNFFSAAVDGDIAPGLPCLADDRTKLLVEGGKWKGVWSQNYFGMCCTTPVLFGKLLEYHTNTLKLFFDLQGDGVTPDCNGFAGPDGALPEWINIMEEPFQPRFKNDEGCGHAEQFDFWVEGSAASVLSFADLLLSTRDREMTDRYLPRIEKALAWLLSRRDTATGLLKAGVSGTLIERAYGATYRGPGKSDYGLPSGVIVNTAKALDLAADLEEFAGCPEQAELHRKESAALLEALKQLVQDNSYLINYIDADGIRHGVEGAEKYAYLEGNANSDMAAWGSLDDKIANSALTRLRKVSPTPLAVCVWPVHDDAEPTYQTDDPAYGGLGDHWNGATWYSSQARYIYGLMRLSRFEEALAAAKRMQELYQTGTLRDMMGDYGRLDHGSYSPEAADAYYIDGFGALGGFLRGLFILRYRANSVELAPRLPEEMESFEQQKPYRWGTKKIFCKVTGKGSKVTQISVNGKTVVPAERDGRFVFPYDSLPEEAVLEFVRK